MITFASNSSATNKQINYINGILSSLKRYKVEHPFLDCVKNDYNGKSISLTQASDLLNKLEKIRVKHNENDAFWEEGKNQIKASAIFDVINQRNATKTISNIVVDWNKHVIDPNYGNDNKSILIRIALNLADLTETEKSKLDESKNYFVEMVVAKGCWDSINEVNKAGLIYKVKDKVIIDVASKKFVTINNEQFIIVGLNLKHKQWKRIVDDEGAVINLNANHTMSNKTFEYHGKFWNSLNDVNSQYHKQAMELLNLANQKLNNKLANIGVFEEFIKSFEYSNQEIEALKEQIFNVIVNDEVKNSDPPAINEIKELKFNESIL